VFVLFRSLKTAYGNNTSFMKSLGTTAVELMAWNNGSPNPLVFYDGTTVWGDSCQLTTNWTLAGYTYNGTTLVYYVNGTNQESASSSARTNAALVTLGSYEATSFTGYVGGVWAYARNLTAGEVTNLSTGTEPTGSVLRVVFTGDVPPVVDASTNALDLTFLSSSDPVWSIPGYYTFGGTVLTSGSARWSTITTQLTLSVWAKPTTRNNYDVLAGLQSNDTELCDLFLTKTTLGECPTNALVWRSNVGGANYSATTNGSYASWSNAWKHVIVTHDANAFPRVHLYVDNVDQPLAVTNAAASLGVANIFIIGNDTQTVGANSFDGDMDSVRIWNRVLSEAERTVVYTNKPPEVP
jgi:hypothetical protein